MGLPIYRWGGTGGSTGSISNSAISQNQYWCASFILTKAKPIAKIRVYQSAAASGGSIAAYILPNDASGQPDITGGPPPTNVLDTSTTTSPLASNGVLELVFNSSFTPTVGNQYWIAIKNTHASINPGFGNIPAGSSPGILSQGFARRIYTTSWQAQVYDCASVIIEFSDGTCEGWLATVNGTSTEKSYYASESDFQEYGLQITTPDNCYLNTVGIGGMQTGTGAVDFRIKLYYGTQEIISVNSGDQFITSIFALWLDRPLSIPPKTDLRIMLAPTNGSTSAYRRFYSATVDTNSDAIEYLKIRPGNGTARLANRTNAGWQTPDNTRLPWLWLLLDKDKPFIELPLNRRKFNSMR